MEIQNIETGIYLSITHYCAVHRGEFFQFPFRWFYYYRSNKSTGKETGKMHYCAVQGSM